MGGYLDSPYDTPFYYADFGNRCTTNSMPYSAAISSYANKATHSHQPSMLRCDRSPDEEDYPEKSNSSRKHSTKPRPPYNQTRSTSSGTTLTPSVSPISSSELKQQLNLVYAALKRVEAERENLQRQMMEGRRDRSVMERELADARRENQRLLKWLEGLTGMGAFGMNPNRPIEDAWGCSVYAEGM